MWLAPVERRAGELARWSVSAGGSSVWAAAGVWHTGGVAEQCSEGGGNGEGAGRTGGVKEHVFELEVAVGDAVCVDVE